MTLPRTVWVIGWAWSVWSVAKTANRKRVKILMWDVVVSVGEGTSLMTQEDGVWFVVSKLIGQPSEY
jgi:hypothetical protein